MAKDSDNETGWRKFQKISFDKKRAARRIRKAETATVRHAHKFILKRWRNLRDVRYVIVSWAVAVGCLILAAGLQLYWDQRAYTTNAGALGGTYAEGSVGTIDNLNPLYAESLPARIAGQLIFSRLLQYDSTGHLNYDLAEKMTINDQATEYTLTLRAGARWHDGAKVTARDVAFTVGLFQTPATQASQRGWDGVRTEQIDDRTIKFILPASSVLFRNALTFPILPAHILADVAPDQLRENAFSYAPIGSGPFSFKLLQDTHGTSGQKILYMTANTRYYSGSPKLARFQLHSYPSDEALRKALVAGEINGANGLSASAAAQLPDERFLVMRQPIQSGVYAFFNTKSDVLSNVVIRKALRQAVDTAEVRKAVGNRAPSLTSPYTPLHAPGDQLDAVPLDMKAAREALDAAGWKLEGSKRSKDGKELQIAVVTAKNVEYERTLEVLIGAWRELGVTVTEQVIDASDPTQNFVSAILQPRMYDVLIYQIDIGGDPDVYSFWHSSRATSQGVNLSNYSSSIADDILASARSSSGKLRDAKHAAFVRQWNIDIPAIPLYQAESIAVVTRNVGGIAADTTVISPDLRYTDVINWTVGTRAVYKTP